MARTRLSTVLRHVRTLAEAGYVRKLTDGELLARFREAGEEAAFTALVQRHGPMVLSVGRRLLHDWPAAEDVFQATFLVLALALCAGLAAAGAGLAGRPPSEAGPAQAVREEVQHVTEADGPRLDGDGRPLPAGAAHRLGSRRFRIVGRNDFALPTPDGKYVLIHPQPSLSAYAAHGLVLVDLDTGLRVRSFKDSRRVPKMGVYDAIRPAAFSPDGKKLYALAWHKSEKDGSGFAQWANFDNPCKRVLLVWAVATGKLAAEWNFPPVRWPGDSLVGLNVSPDGTRLYVYGAIRMNAIPGQTIRGVPGVHVLDAATGKALQTWEGAGYPVGTVAGGREVVTYRRGDAITARDVATGKIVRTFTVRGTVPAVSVSPDGKAVAAVVTRGQKDDAMACEIILWEAATGREVRRLRAGPETVQYSTARVVFARDGRRVYLAGPGQILRWDLSDGRALPTWPVHSGRIADLLVRPGKKELVSAGASDGALRRWDAATGKCLTPTDAYVGEIAVTRTPDGRGIVAVDEAGRLDVWDVTTGQVTRTLRMRGRMKHELLFTPDGKQLLVAAQTGPNSVWDLATGTQVGEFAPPPKKDPKADEYWWGTLGFSPDGRRLVASKFGRGTWMWTWPDRRVLWHEATPQECCLFRDGDTLACSDWHGPIEIRDARTGAVKATAPGPGMAHVAYSPDLRRMVTAHLDGSWRVRDGVTGAVLKKVQGFQKVWSVAFSPTGWLLAVAGDNSVRVYDTASWHEVARFDGHEGTVATVFFGPDEATLVSASAEDGTALVWSLKPPAGRDPPDLTKLWADLAGDGPVVRRAVWAAVQHPEVAVRLLREKWPVPQQAEDVNLIRRLIADLDSPVFRKREAATVQLRKLGRRAEAELRMAAATASPEVKRRIDGLLTRLAPPATAESSPEDARELRAVWALELAGTPEARALLAAWAAAKVGNRLSAEAAGALKRGQRKR
jgi:WD40 repeat protein